MGSEESETNLVGFKNFVRTNPKSDKFPVRSFHHIEFYCTDATTTSSKFSFALGLPISSISNISTANSVHSSVLLKSRSLSFLLTAPYPPHLPGGNLNPTLPSFDSSFAYEFVQKHGLAVRAIGIEVADAGEAFRVALANGGQPAFEPVQLGFGFSMAEVELYGDVVLRFVSLPEPDYIDESVVLTLADEDNHINKHNIDKLNWKYGKRKGQY